MGPRVSFVMRTEFPAAAALHLAAIRDPPLRVLIPTYSVLSALIPAQADTSAEVLGDLPTPASFMYGAVHGFYLVPTLLRCDLRQICRREVVFQAAAGGQGRR